MENNKSKNVVIVLLIVIIVILLTLIVLFATGTISFKSNDIDNNEQNETINVNNNQINDSNSLSKICIAEIYESEKLKILDMENKTEKIGAIGGSTRGYNVTTTVTKEHNYTSTPEDEELYTNDMLGTLYVLYKNKLYYTSQKEIISKYCTTNIENGSTKITCDYSKFSDSFISKFNAISIDVNLKAIGSYGNAGSGAPTPYALTNDGKVINIPNVLSHDYNSCGIMYDNSEYLIDRIFNMYLYDGVEYTILLKDGSLITRDVDRDNPIVLEH